ncbi:MAG: hypothetical protein JST05_09970 [Acidobacteria bacterium]|nr:hypothetical protein [Acidobacteriota bacterium]
MFKLPNPPSPKADTHELADFAEFLCWDSGGVSKREILAYLGRVDDNENNIGCDDDDDENSDLLDEVMNEIERRAVSCGDGYPFILELEGTVLKLSKDDQQKGMLYRYLLLCTRLNMKDKRVHDGIDGSLLLEEISAHVLKNYLGGSPARAIVFGTAVAGSFEDKVNNLCQELREGDSFRNLDGSPVSANDDKLDAVAWKPFSDQLAGQLIIFGQCKTGSNWRDETTQLQPDSFIKKWLLEPIVVNPVRAFCVSEAADRSRWKGTCTAAGLLLDRCRLVDFSEGLAQDLLDRITRWTKAAKQTVTFASA